MISFFIDVQPDFLKFTHNSNQFLHAIKDQYAFAKKHNSQCIIFETVHPKHKVVTSKSIIGNEQEGDIFITKQYRNGFTQTNLAQILKKSEDSNIFGAGLYDNQCMYFTLREAKEDKQYTIYSKKELIGSHSNPQNFKDKKITIWMNKNIIYPDKREIQQLFNHQSYTTISQ